MNKNNKLLPHIYIYTHKLSLSIIHMITREILEILESSAGLVVIVNFIFLIQNISRSKFTKRTLEAIRGLALLCRIEIG